MNNATLTVRPRTADGKQAAKRTRRSGWTPAVLYGGEGAPVPVQIESHTLELFLRRNALTTLVTVTVEGGETTQVLVREPVRHPISDEFVHIDLMRVSSRSRVHVSVPITLTGQMQSPGVQIGGVVDHVLHELDIECLATEIPEHITLDISHLQIGDHIAVNTLKLENVRIITDLDATIVTISAPRVEVEPVAEGEEAVAEPEVVGRKRAEEEEEDEK